MVRIFRFFSFMYTVVKGDSLTRIAKRFDIADWKTIYQLNKGTMLDEDTLDVGQKLLLPGGPPSSLAPPPAGPSASHGVWSFNVGACSGDGGPAAEQAHVEAWLASTHPGEGWSYERLWRSDDGTIHAQCRREVAAAAAATAQARAVSDVAVPEEVPTLQLRRQCKELGLDRDGSRVALLARLEEAGAPVVAEGKVSVSPGVTAGGATDGTATEASASTPTELAPEATALVEVALARAGDNAQELRAALEGAPTPAQRESVGKITAPMAPT